MSVLVNPYIIAATGGSSPTVLAEYFSDLGDTLTPGTSANFTITVPTGTTAIGALLVEQNGTANSAYTSLTIDGTSIPSLANNSAATAGTMLGRVFGIGSSIPIGASLTGTLSGRSDTSRAAHLYVVCMSGVDTNTANWTEAISAASTTTFTTREASLTPTTADGFVFGHGGFRQVSAVGTITSSGVTQTASNETTAGSGSLNSIETAYGYAANTSTSARNVGVSCSSTGNRAVAVAVHIPAA